MLRKHQLTFLISVFRFRSGTAWMYRRYGGYCLFCAWKTRISISHRIGLVCRNILHADSICRTSHLSFHSLLFTYLLQYPVSWWDWERGLDLMFKSQAGLLWSDREKCWWRRQIQLTGQRAQASTCLYGPGGLLLLLWLMFGNNRVIEPGCVDTGANWATRVNGKAGIHRDLWPAVCAGSISPHGQISPTGAKPFR